MSDTNTLKLVLDAAGISSVIWIDDRFDLKSPSLSDVIQCLGTLYYATVQPTHPALSGLRLDSDVSAWSDYVTNLAESDQSLFGEIANAVVDQAQVLVGELGEYTQSELTAIKESFGNIECMGFSAWQAQKPRLLAGMSRETLIIVDREFMIEGRSIRHGDDILKELLRTPEVQASLVMLTHSVEVAGVSALRRELSDGDARFMHRFAVVPKGGEGDPVTRLRESIRVVMTHQTCFSLLGSITKVMKAGIDTALAELMDQSVYDLDAVVFEKSLEEGASEADVLTRLVLLRQRIEVDRHFAEDQECHAKINALRRLRAVYGTTAPDVATKTFENLRTSEVFDTPEIINRRHSPLACGDLFRGEGQQNKLWVLLAQPCDIAVRSDGSRKFGQGFLILAKPVEADPGTGVRETLQAVRGALEAGDSSAALALLGNMPAHLEKLTKVVPSQRYFPLHGRLDGVEWRMDFNQWTPVNLECLELCVFNSDGALKLDPKATLPDALLPGWQKRYDKAKTQLQKLSTQSSQDWILGGSDFSNRTPKLQNGVLSFKYKRAGRIRTPRSVAAYAAFASFQSRAAFDHDFSELLTKSAR